MLVHQPADSLRAEIAEVVCATVRPNDLGIRIGGGRLSGADFVEQHANVLINAIDHCKLVEIPSAGHLSPYTHKSQVQRLCSQALEAAAIADSYGVD